MVLWFEKVAVHGDGNWYGPGGLRGALEDFRSTAIIDENVTHLLESMV